jgi:hypothetical protein
MPVSLAQASLLTAEQGANSPVTGFPSSSAASVEPQTSGAGTVVLSEVSRYSVPQPTRFDEARDTIKALAQRFGCHRIHATPRALGATETMHMPCHLSPGNQGICRLLSEIGRLS